MTGIIVALVFVTALGILGITALSVAERTSRSARAARSAPRAPTSSGTSSSRTGSPPRPAWCSASIGAYALNYLLVSARHRCEDALAARRRPAWCCCGSNGLAGHDAAGAARRAGRRRRSPRGACERQSHDRRVLIVEDQPAVAKALRVLFDLHDIDSAIASRSGRGRRGSIERGEVGARAAGHELHARRDGRRGRDRALPPHARRSIPSCRSC